MKAHLGISLNRWSIILLAVMMLLVVDACKKKKPKSQPTVVPVQRVEAPVFNADSAYFFIEHQVGFGPRVPNTAPHAKCLAWITSKLEHSVDTVILQDFRTRLYDGREISGTNIIGSINPTSKNRLLLCAHWDTRPYADHDPDPTKHKSPILGANDGASGVGVLLEIARLMKEKQPSKGIDIVLFDLEDWGEPEWAELGTRDSWALGAQHWAKNPHVPAYHAQYGILLDMVGAEGAVFTMEGYSMYYAPDIMRRVWEEAHRSGYGDFFSFRETGMIADDHYYVNEYARIPTIDIIHYDATTGSGFFPHWHTVDDDMDNISRTTLKAVGQVVLNYVYNN